jgi:uncharacterized repeat protein (TIGR03843 family)
LAVVLREGSLDVQGRLAGSSNGTLLCQAPGSESEPQLCVYKPVAGERPLWDFPDGTLGLREVATYELAHHLHQLDPTMECLVPLTVWRDDGPFGPGACQEWVHVADDSLVDLFAPDEVPQGWRIVLRARDDRDLPLVLAHANDDRLRRMALLDLVANNSDRKGGHVLIDRSGGLFGVDHGLCFNEDDKLRTVLWGWADDALTPDELGLLTELAVWVASGALDPYLTPAEIARTRDRARALARAGRFPRPSGEWPAIPWPAF